MDSSLTKTFGLAAITAVIATFAARADGPMSGEAGEAAGTIAADSADKTGGAAVAPRDSSVTPKWLNDANVLALIGTMNARQIAAADIELSSWHSDTVRALWASMARERAEMQHSVDSAAAALRVVPVPPAMAAQVTSAFQAQMDSTLGHRGASLAPASVVLPVDHP